MASLSQSEPRRLYSWWWDSHISPKNSKWLQENLKDMDANVKSMIKLIEEDADSFARRAEMYYKKRPELMKLVEEFYRAYRALAERYNHATGELRHAHRTIAKAFPNQVPFELFEDSPSKSLARGEPYTPETQSTVKTLPDIDDSLESSLGLPHFDLYASKKIGFHTEDSARGGAKKCLNQMHDILDENEAVTQSSKADEMLELSSEIQHLKDKVFHATEIAGKAESEVQGLKRALTDSQSEKEGVLLQYQRCLEKLSSVEGELEIAHCDLMMFNERATRAEIEAQTLKEALLQLEVEKKAGLIKHKMYMENMSNLESMYSRSQEDMRGLDDRAIQAEKESQSLRNELSMLELEKKRVHYQYEQCLLKVSDLENLISTVQDEGALLKKQAERAGAEVVELQKDMVELNKEKEDSNLHYRCCLEFIAKLKKDTSAANEIVKHLSDEVLIGTEKLHAAKDKCNLLEMSNQSLEIEADNLVKKIAMKDLELYEKKQELESLQMHLQKEHLHHVKIEASLESLQRLHYQSQDDQKNLALKVKNALQLVKDTEVCNLGLEAEVQKVKNENQSLSQIKLSSSNAMENMKNEILSLREMKERLEHEVSLQMSNSNSLKDEILVLKAEIMGLGRNYQAIVKQVESVGIDPKSVETSVKNLRDDNSRLAKICEQGKTQNENLLKTLESLEELLKEKAFVESSVSDLKGELESSRVLVTELRESCHLLHGEKSILVAEKASLLSQLHAITENMHNLMKENSALEHFLCETKVEFDGLRAKSKGLEDKCDFLKNDRLALLSERNTLVYKLENVEKMLKSVENSFMGLEVKYADLAKAKEAINDEVEELKVCLSAENQERSISELHSETRLAKLEDHIHLLQEENKWNKKEYEEELDKALEAQFEITILQMFIKEIVEKNQSLIVECQKHVEASKLAEKLISELESESLELQVEAELLLDEIESLRLGLYQVFKALETGTESVLEDKVENEHTFVHHILKNVEDLKCYISRHEDDKQKLLVENSVLLTLLKQSESTGMTIELKKTYMEQELKAMAYELAMITREKDELQETNKQLKSSMNKDHRHVAVLEAELGSLCVKQGGLHKLYRALQEVYSQVDQENKCLMKKVSDLEKEKSEMEQQNDTVLNEFLATANQCDVLRSFGTQKIRELHLLIEDLNRQHEVHGSLENQASMLRDKLDLKNTENSLLKDSIYRLEMAMQGLSEYNVLMKQDVLSGKEALIRMEEMLFDTQMKFEAAENINSSLSNTVDELKIDIQNSLKIKKNIENSILQISENNAFLEKEFETLLIVNKYLESELCILDEYMNEEVSREQALNLGLQGKTNELDLWQAEAATCYFELQVSSVSEVFLKNKVKELTWACQSLENDQSSNMSKIEQMTKRTCLMENEIGVLKSQILVYSPVVDSLREDITFLENSVFLRTNAKAAHNQKLERLEIASDPGGNVSEEHLESQFPVLDGVSSLHDLQMRIKAVGKLMERMNKSASRRRSNSYSKLEREMSEIEELKPRRSLGRDRRENNRKKGCTSNEFSDTPRLQNIQTKSSEVRNGTLMKDIPLDQVSRGQHHAACNRVNAGASDQMLELWETAEDRNRSQTIGESLRSSFKMTDRDIVYDQFDNVNWKNAPPSTDSDLEKELGVDMLEVSTKINERSREVNSRRILERLASDAHKLDFLQTTVQSLMAKLDVNQRSSKPKNVDFETVNEQLVEAEETVLHLVDLNGKLVKNVEENRSPGGRTSPQLKEAARVRRKKVNEQAKKGSESIGRLQLELQKIQYMLMKLDDEKKHQGNNKFFRNRTIVPRDFIYNGRKNSGKRKKSPFCGCIKPATTFERSP